MQKLQTGRAVFLTLGLLLVLVNIAANIAEPQAAFSNSDNQSFSIGYFFGSHVLLFLGIYLLRAAYKRHKTIVRLQQQLFNAEIEAIGQAE